MGIILEMNRYIALLRGINISGKNKISMPDLKAALIEKGFSEVSTHLNSGNIIFSDAEAGILHSGHLTESYMQRQTGGKRQL